MVVWEDQLRSHPAYVHAAIAASEVRLDRPSDLKSEFDFILDIRATS